MGAKRMRIDLFGDTVWVAYGDARVAALTIVTLAHPVLRADDDALIALEDVAVFFAKAFQLTLTQSAGAARRSSSRIFRGGRTPAVDSRGSRFTRRRNQEPVAPELSPERRIASIVIDPGHGGFDKGLEGSGGLVEKDLALTVGLALRDALATRVTQNVAVTRNVDLSLTLKERALRVAEFPESILISIHAAGSFSPLAQGVSIYYGPRNPRAGVRTSNLATARYRSRLRGTAIDQHPIIAQEIADALETATGSPLRFVGEAPVRLLANIGTYGLHIEVGCLSNPAEEGLLRTDAHIEKLASAIADGLASYLGGSKGEPAILEPSEELLP
jgi:N-acetylmuramoyl-L-alanine amidase